MRILACIVILMAAAGGAFAAVVTSPEIGGSSGVAVAGLVAGGLMVLRSRRSK